MEMLTRKQRRLRAVVVGALLASAACSNEASDLDRAGTRMLAIERQLSRSTGEQLASLCLDYASVCERTGGICLNVESAAMRARCDAISGRCERNLDTYCALAPRRVDASVPVDGGVAQVDAGAVSRDASASACTGCTAPPHAVAMCDSTTPCHFVCEPGFHRCGSTCQPNDSIASCGSACEPCPTRVGDANSIAVCDGTRCGLSCKAGFEFDFVSCVAPIWPTEGGSQQRTGASVSRGPSSVTIKWTFKLGSQILAPPAVGADGTVYALGASWVPGGVAGLVVGLDGGSGTKKWGFPTPWDIRCPPTVGPDGTVYFGEEFGALFALAGNTGAKRWEKPIGMSRAAPLVGPDGTLYVANQNGGILALDSQSGVERWTATTGFNRGSAALGADGTLYLVGPTSRLSALDGTSGAKKWTFELGPRASDSESSPPAVGADGTVYVTNDTKLYALSSHDAAVKWSFAAPEAHISFLSAPRIGPDGRVLLTTLSNDDTSQTLHALDGQSGTIEWELHFGNAPRLGRAALPVSATDGTVYAVFQDKLYALNGRTGAKLWEFALPIRGSVFGPVLGANGMLYLGEEDGTVYALGDP